MGQLLAENFQHFNVHFYTTWDIYRVHVFVKSLSKMQSNEVLKPAKYFSELEKGVLLALVEKYKYVLECKKSDARTIALKQRTWQALAHEYNSQPSVSLRDFKQLKKCWENIKARTKKILAHERREKVKGSVGSAMNSHEALKEKVANMIPEQIYYIQNPPEEESEYHREPSNQASWTVSATNSSRKWHVIHGKSGGVLFLSTPPAETKISIQTTDFQLIYSNNFPTNWHSQSPSSRFFASFEDNAWKEVVQDVDSETYAKSKMIHSNLDLDGKKLNILDLELLIDEQGKVQTKPCGKTPPTNSLCPVGSFSPRAIKQESFVVAEREVFEEENAVVNLPECESTFQSEPSCSAVRITANKNYRSNKAVQESVLKKMHEEEHHQQMSVLQLQLIQMNEMHVAKIQQIERECEIAEEEHRLKMEILNKKKMFWERKLQTIPKEWSMPSFNRPFPKSP